jgi:hypothetical protein
MFLSDQGDLKLLVYSGIEIKVFNIDSSKISLDRSSPTIGMLIYSPELTFN